MIVCPRCEYPNIEQTQTCPICSYHFIGNNKMLNLPEVDYKGLGWTLAQQLRKIGEELGKVAEAAAENNPEQIIRESLDAIQTFFTLINMVSENFNMPLDKFYDEHVEKLRQKGYLKE